MPDGAEQRDFFISFNSADLAYAEAIDSALRANGFTTFYHPRDLPPGGNVPIWMDHALDNSAQTLALYSPAYTSDKAVYSKAERYATWWQDPVSDKRKLIPVLLRETKFTPLMAMISRIGVLGMTPAEAAARVLERLRKPEEAEPRDVWRRGLPIPAVFNVAYRPNPNFTGRFEALDSLQNTLRAGSNAAITAIAGMGGIGKTTLAAEYCHRFGGRYAGVWWVRAEQEPTMLADIAALGEKVGINLSGNVEKDARAALDHLGGVTEPWLMVYDNAPNPDAVRRWLPVGAVRCIITSRFTEFGDLAPVTRVDQWPDAVTADYLLARTGRDDAAGAARLAEVLDGLPLAAEQAAAFLSPRKNISFDDYAKEIARLIARKKDVGAAGDYPDTVYAAFVKSLETLQGMPGGEIALDLLRLCAFLSPDGVDLVLLTVEWGNRVFPATFSAAMADKFARNDALAALTSLSLLRQEDGPAGPMLIFHRLLLEVVRDWMGEEVRALWGSAAVQLVSRAFPDGISIDPSSWLRCARLVPHVPITDAHASGTIETRRALHRVLNQAGNYLSARGDRAGELALRERSLAIARDTREDEPLMVLTSLVNLSDLYADLNRLENAERAAYEALHISEQLLSPNDPRLAVALSNLAKIYRKRRAFAKAEPIFFRVANFMEVTHGAQSREYSVSLGHLGTLYFDWADEPSQAPRRADAINYATKALVVTRKVLGERNPETATCYKNLSVMKAKTGDLASAEYEVKRAIAIMLSLDLGQHPGTRNMIVGLISFWNQSGRADKAVKLRGGDVSFLVPVIAQIELEHRAWVVEDPQNRHFGPDSFFLASKDEALAQSLQILAAAGVDIKDLVRRIKAGKVSLDDIAKLVAETIVNKNG